ncbi:hypothetical protein B0H13DRAFT_2661083 [Mycena leptocephala]|nr:hypothetical protein B0H13DRAFT_2661083 [Mycena leptocephala]
MYSLLPSLVIALACSTVALSAGPTTVPDPPSGSTNVVVDVSSTSKDVAWTGAWEAESSSTCSSGTKVQRSSGTDSVSVPFGAFSMSYNFTGSAVYVSLATNNAMYGISLDGKLTFYGDPDFDPATPDNCTFGYSGTGLAEKSTHALVISVGALHSGRKRSLNARAGGNTAFNAPWLFEIESVVITQSGSGGSSSSSSSSGSSGSSNSTSGSTKPNAAQRQRGSSSWVMLPTFFVGALALAFCLREGDEKVESHFHTVRSERGHVSRNPTHERADLEERANARDEHSLGGKNVQRLAVDEEDGVGEDVRVSDPALKGEGIEVLPSPLRAFQQTWSGTTVRLDVQCYAGTRAQHQ